MNLTSALVLIYIPVYLAITLFVSNNFKNFNPKIRTISMLGSSKSKYRHLFNVSTFVLGLLIMSFSGELEKHISIIRMYPYLPDIVTLIGVLVLLISLVPFHLSHSIHDILGFSYMSLIVYLAILYLGLVSDNVIPGYFRILSYSLIAFSLLLLINVLKGFKKYSFPKTIWFVEWGAFSMYLAIFFFTAYELLHYRL